MATNAIEHDDALRLDCAKYWTQLGKVTVCEPQGGTHSGINAVYFKLELMADDRDFLQRQAESSVRLSRPFRAVLAVVVLLGAAFFIFLGGLLLLGTDRSQLPSPTGAFLLAVFVLVLGMGFGYIGTRLLLIRRHAEHLMSARAARIASYCTAAVGGLVLVSSAFLSNLDFAAGGLFVCLMAYWLHVSARRIARGVQ